MEKEEELFCIHIILGKGVTGIMYMRRYNYHITQVLEKLFNYRLDSILCHCACDFRFAMLHAINRVHLTALAYIIV